MSIEKYTTERRIWQRIIWRKGKISYIENRRSKSKERILKQKKPV